MGLISLAKTIIICATIITIIAILVRGGSDD